MSSARRGSRRARFRNYHPLPGLPIGSRRSSPLSMRESRRRYGFGLPVRPALVVLAVCVLLGLLLVRGITRPGSIHHPSTPPVVTTSRPCYPFQATAC